MLKFILKIIQWLFFRKKPTPPPVYNQNTYGNGGY